MSAQEMPVAGVTLDRLDDYLSSDRSPSESMMLSDLDGFLTGLAVGPSLVMPSEWLPIVWGGEQPEFSDEKEMSAVMGGIFSRYNEILRTIDRGDLEPIFWTADDDIVIAADWALPRRHQATLGRLETVIPRRQASSESLSDPGAVRRRGWRFYAWTRCGSRG